MLYPKMNHARSLTDLGGIWRFKLGDETEPGEIWNSPQEMELISVPASYNDQKDDPSYRNHYGWAYYERTVELPAFLYKQSGQRQVLRFDAVTHTAKVYLNGKLILTHKGGFLPFEVEITDLLPENGQITIGVAVDNRISHSTLPVGNEGNIAFFGSDNPGIPSVEATKIWRKKQNLPNFDFFNFAGINRPVRLYSTPASYIEDITLVPSLDGDNGILDYRIDTAGVDTDAPVRLKIMDANGNCVAEAAGSAGQLHIPQANLWWPYPGTPYLYQAEVHYGEDCYTEEFGFRTVEVKGTKFLINGKPFYFKGFSKHEDSPFHGRGLDLCLDVKDINLLHWRTPIPSAPAIIPMQRKFTGSATGKASLSSMKHRRSASVPGKAVIPIKHSRSVSTMNRYCGISSHGTKITPVLSCGPWETNRIPNIFRNPLMITGIPSMSLPISWIPRTAR